MPFDGTTINNPIVDMLRAGRAKVERGWGQGNTYLKGNVCAIGGIACVADPKIEQRGFFVPNDFAVSDHYFTALDVLNRALTPRWALTPRTSPRGIPIWNDDPDRTQADVLALYDRAIELAITEAMVKVA